MSKDADDVDSILRDIIPYCSDIEFITSELEMSMTEDDPVGYIEERIKIETDSRAVDLRILLNRLLKISYY